VNSVSDLDFGVYTSYRQKLGQLGMSEFLQSKMAIIREQLTNLKLNHARHASTVWNLMNDH